MEDKKMSILRQVIEEGFGNGDLYVIDQLMNENCVDHQFGMNEGKAGVKKAVISLTKAFSNRNYELIQSSQQGNIVWMHYRATGTHTGAFMGHEATGNDYAIDVIDIAKIEDGQITEHWGVPDRFALMMQLGFLKPTNTKHEDK